MKIVDVCAFYCPTGGGVRTYVERKLAGDPTFGHELVVIAPGKRDRIERRGPGATIRWLAAPRFPLDRNYRYFADRAALHAALDEEAADVVEVASPWRSASLVADWQGDAVTALIGHADPLSAFAYRWFGGVAERDTIDRAFDWYWRHLRRLDRRFDLMVCASESLSARLRAGGLSKVVTNPMGIEPDRFSPALRDETFRAELLAACELPPEATLLLGVGRHSAEKRWELVATAATRAGRDRPIGLVIVGGGRRTAPLIAAAAGNPHIRLFAPISDRAQLARLMASADALVHGCEAETFCFAAAEAIASGLPIVAPDQGGAADLARASGGITYRAADVSAAAAAIAALPPRHIPRRAIATRSMDDHFSDLFALYAAALAQRRTIAAAA